MGYSMIQASTIALGAIEHSPESTRSAITAMHPLLTENKIGRPGLDKTLSADSVRLKLLKDNQQNLKTEHNMRNKSPNVILGLFR